MNCGATHITIFVSPRRVASVLALIVLIFTAADLAGQFAKDILGYTRLVDRFDTDLEGNFPSLYSASALLLCSILLAVIASAKRAARDRYILHWHAMALIFAYLAFDEAFYIHESFTLPLRSALNATLFFWYTWIVPAGIFALGFVLANLRFLLCLPKPTRRLFILAGTFVVGGGLGFEALAAAWDYLYDPQDLGLTYSLVILVISGVEEALEMMGVVILIYALLKYMSAHVPEIRVRVGSGPLNQDTGTAQHHDS